MARFPLVVVVPLLVPGLSAQLRGFGQGAGMSRSLTAGGECFMETAVPAPIGPATTWSAGGAAIDRRRDSLWITNGTELQERALANYQVLGEAVPHRVLKASHVSGLTYDIRRNELIQLETRDGNAALVTYAVQIGGGLTFRRSQSFALPAADMRATDLAYDGRRARLWVASRREGQHIAYSALHLSLFTQMHSGAWQHLCTRAITSAGYAAIDAMTYDEENDTLHAASRTRMLHLQPATNDCGNVTPIWECAVWHDSSHGLRGFDLKRAYSIPMGNTGCAGNGCSNCFSLLDPVGQPVIGNDAFAMVLTQSQSGGLATLWARPGPAMAVLYGCGFAFTPPDLSVAVAVNVAIAGGLPCTGTAVLPMPLPVEYSLAGTDLLVQAFIACPGGGLAMSNAFRLALDSE